MNPYYVMLKTYSKQSLKIKQNKSLKMSPSSDTSATRAFRLPSAQPKATSKRSESNNGSSTWNAGHTMAIHELYRDT